MSEYILHVVYLIAFGMINYFNYIKVMDYRFRAGIIIAMFNQYPDLILAYCFGWDYICSLIYCIYKKNIGVNDFYPELDTFDRPGLVAIAFLRKEKSVTWKVVNSSYIVFSSLIIIRIIYYVVIAGSAD